MLRTIRLLLLTLGCSIVLPGLTFTDKIFLTTFFQYNTRADNVNLNARLQLRYKPASDFFLVYTENYLPGTLASKNYSLVFKFTYWLNI